MNIFKHSNKCETIFLWFFFTFFFYIFKRRICIFFFQLLSTSKGLIFMWYTLSFLFMSRFSIFCTELCFHLQQKNVWGFSFTKQVVHQYLVNCIINKHWVVTAGCSTQCYDGPLCIQSTSTNTHTAQNLACVISSHDPKETCHWTPSTYILAKKSVCDKYIKENEKLYICLNSFYRLCRIHRIVLLIRINKTMTATFAVFILSLNTAGFLRSRSESVFSLPNTWFDGGLHLC